MKDEKIKKLKEIYEKISTPDEKILDLLEKIDKEKLRGEDGKTPIKGDDYFTEEEIKEFKKEVTPKKGIHYFDGKIPTEREIREIIIPLIPEPIRGKDGTLITPEQIRDKLLELKGSDRLSVFALKDLEWLKDGKGMNWSSAGFKVYTDTTLSGDGSFGNPLHVVSGGGGGGGSGAIKLTTPDTINDSNTIFHFYNPSGVLTNPTMIVMNGLLYRQNGGAITWTVSGGAINLSSSVGTGGSIFGIFGGVISETISTTGDNNSLEYSTMMQPIYIVMNGASYLPDNATITWTYGVGVTYGLVTVSSPPAIGGSIFGLSGISLTVDSGGIISDIN